MSLNEVNSVSPLEPLKICGINRRIYLDMGKHQAICVKIGLRGGGVLEGTHMG